MKNSGPVAFITGAAKRIGAAMACQLHSEGYRVIIHYGHSKDDALALAEKLNNQRADSAICLQANLCNSDEVSTLGRRALGIWGQIDVLVNNASSFYPTPVGEISEEDWVSLIGSNVKGPLFLSQALAPALAVSNGCIINMVDMHVDRPLPKHSVYLIAKSGLASLTKSLAIDLAPHVRVNGIAPGAILWPEREMGDDEKEKLLSSIPLGELGAPADIAKTLSFLVSVPYITGQIIYVDGGRSLHTGASA
ncbi:pteridine reductase [Alteromonas macleodii str. 'Black Sea 11']|uniref:pteridine reductase n=1 Tax=Alteromonas abrolhosensis TaxID=1892904 RepID=UPI000286E313|nr:pteridine reductase [Alteromonas abrolhosensis]AFT78043.1 pteridine reductase [Alteromonas macleodii str. 'Black Sea 11']